MKMPLRLCGILLIEHENAGGNASAVKQVGRQADDALQIARAHKVLRMTASALPRKSTPCGRMHAPLPVLFIERMMCSR